MLETSSKRHLLAFCVRFHIEHVEISFRQISQKILSFRYKNVLLTPHNVTIAHILSGHTTFYDERFPRYSSGGDSASLKKGRGHFTNFAVIGKCVTNQILFNDLQLSNF